MSNSQHTSNIRRARFETINTRDTREAMDSAGHDFTVEMVPITMPCGQVIYDKVATRRSDTGQYLGTVGRGYNPIQPVDFYNMAQELVDNTGGVINKTISMYGGAVIGISFELAIREYVAGDQVALNFLMMTSFNSRYAIMGRALSRRFFCENQLASSQRLFNIKNTINNTPRLEVATKMLSYYGREMDDFDNNMRMLTKYRMNDDQAVDWFRKLLPAPAKGSKRSNSYHDNVTEDFTDLLVKGKGTNHPGVRGTGYGALNALTEHCNHNRSTRVSPGRTEEEVRFESVTFGTADAMMQSGFASLVKMAKEGT